MKHEPFDRERIERLKSEWPDWEERFNAPMAPVNYAPKTDVRGRPRNFDIGKWSSARKAKKGATKE